MSDEDPVFPIDITSGAETKNQHDRKYFLNASELFIHVMTQKNRFFMNLFILIYKIFW